MLEMRSSLQLRFSLGRFRELNGQKYEFSRQRKFNETLMEGLSPIFDFMLPIERLKL